MATTMQWPTGWEQISPDERQALEVELRREDAPGHPLHSVAVSALARRYDCDDVLFGLSGSASVAVVHLSYGEADALWPHTQFFSSLKEWAKQAA